MLVVAVAAVEIAAALAALVVLVLAGTVVL
jgi:hypothetical protein